MAGHPEAALRHVVDRVDSAADPCEVAVETGAGAASPRDLKDQALTQCQP